MASSLLPQHEGYLPYFLLYASVSALLHTVGCYLSGPKALLQFSGKQAPPPNGLLARVYGVKNVYTALIRGYAAYHITNPELYTLAAATFVGVLFLYATECFTYKTVGFREACWPFVTVAIGLSWMWLSRDFYLA